MKIDLIAGARPNFMKISPIINAIETLGKGKLTYRLIHTGQHYDHKMSGSFFEELNIPQPHINLEVGSGTQAEQTAKIMQGYEALLLKDPSDLCLVVGDVTSTMACAIAAKKLNIKVAHIEAGIRSNDRTMPEEINRLVTDAISDYFFTTTIMAGNQLLDEGHNPNAIFLVGNTMIDTLLKHQKHFQCPEFFEDFGLQSKKYYVLTLHRPANVDDPKKLQHFLAKIVEGAGETPIVFPIHPRTRKILTTHNIQFDSLYLVEPMGYLKFNYLVNNSLGVVTDSGGITEETTVMGIPCITLRDNTERPETCSIGTNKLIGTNPDDIPAPMQQIQRGEWKKGGIPELWDGKTGERIVEVLLRLDS
jgi:UDP-N-acetylglucosamine 2-epimerase (non-hydrolysing)